MHLAAPMLTRAASFGRKSFDRQTFGRHRRDLSTAINCFSCIVQLLIQTNIMSAKYLSAKYLSAKCLLAKYLSAKYLSTKYLLAKYLSAK